MKGKLALVFILLIVTLSCSQNKSKVNSEDDFMMLGQFPGRNDNAPTGSQFAEEIKGLTGQEREDAVYAQLSTGNMPSFCKKLQEVKTEFTDNKGKPHTGSFFVMPDYLSVGNDEDFFRVPMTPETAQKLADQFMCSLITKKMSDLIYKNAIIRLDPIPMTEARESSATFYEHNQMIEDQKKDYSDKNIVAGIKKDVVITNRLNQKFEKNPNRVAIYGWHKLDGSAIQPLSTVHTHSYVDYSHGVRLASRSVKVDGKVMQIEDALKNPEIAGLFSDEGVIERTRY